MPPITMKKNYGHTVSVLQNTDKVIACSKADVLSLKEDSYIIIDKDEEFYRISKKGKFIYTKDMLASNLTQLKINENLGTSLSVNDDIKFTHKEYKVVEVSVLDGGTGYVEGDKVKPSSGVCKYNSLDEIDVPATLVVDTVDENGSIVSLTIEQGGLYNIAPNEEDDASSGSGSGARLSLECSLLDNRSVEERTIVDIDLSDQETTIHLNHPLPPRVTDGTLTVEKWELTIDRQYIGDSKFNVSYDIAKDFTPNCGLPLLRGDLNANYLLYNESLVILDKKIKELEDKIDSLGS